MTNLSPRSTGDSVPADTIRQILADFQHFLEFQDMAPNTVQSYLSAAGQFLSLYHTISQEHLMLYKCYLMEHYKPQTVNLRIRAVNCLMESLHLSQDRMLMVRVQQKSFLENVISQADYEYLKSCFVKNGNLLYYFAIRLMATTGMRISELLSLQVEDVKRGYLDIHSKDNKMRRIYIPKMVRQDCLLWLKHIDRVFGDVFLNRYGRRITPAGVRSQLKKYSIRYGLDPAVVYPHSFRHLFARNFMERCGDIAMLSDLLGHESIETTRIYLHRSSTEQKALVNEIVNW